MALPRGPQAVVLGAAQQPWLGAGLHGYLTGLTDLYLNDNRLTALPPEIGNLTGLTWLNLRRNQLTALPPEIGNLTGLTWLYLGGNRLTALLPEIGNLTGLKVLATSTNGTVWDPRNQGWGRAWVNSLRVRL